MPFVQPEIRRLKRFFDDITVVPLSPYGEQIDHPDFVKIDLSLAQSSKVPVLLKLYWAISYPGLWKELFRVIRVGGLRHIIMVLSWAIQAKVTKKWATGRFKSTTLFYTYWRTAVTLGLADFCHSKNNMAVFTRVHGYDLYLERWFPPYQPWFPSLYERLLGTATASSAATDYLVAHGVSKAQLSLFRLGTEDPCFRCFPSADNAVRIASCSSFVPLKRVTLLAEAVCSLAHEIAPRRVIWTHIGDSPERQNVEKKLSAKPDNLKINLRGQLDNSAVLAFYRDNPVDVFLHVSSMEGGVPVVLQEAASVGIPLVATDVGGVREIVSEANGLLIASNPSVAEIVSGLKTVTVEADSQERMQLRLESRKVWENFFSAENNHVAFAKYLRGLFLGKISQNSKEKTMERSHDSESRQCRKERYYEV